MTPTVVKMMNGAFALQYKKKSWFSTKTFYLCKDIDRLEYALLKSGDETFKYASNKDCENSFWSDLSNEWRNDHILNFKTIEEAEHALIIKQAYKTKEGLNELLYKHSQVAQSSVKQIEGKYV